MGGPRATPLAALLHCVGSCRTGAVAVDEAHCGPHMLKQHAVAGAGAWELAMRGVLVPWQQRCCHTARVCKDLLAACLLRPPCRSCVNEQAPVPMPHTCARMRTHTRRTLSSPPPSSVVCALRPLELSQLLWGLSHLQCTDLAIFHLVVHRSIVLLQVRACNDLFWAYVCGGGWGVGPGGAPQHRAAAGACTRGGGGQDACRTAVINPLLAPACMRCMPARPAPHACTHNRQAYKQGRACAIGVQAHARPTAIATCISVDVTCAPRTSATCALAWAILDPGSMLQGPCEDTCSLPLPLFNTHPSKR